MIRLSATFLIIVLFSSSAAVHAQENRSGDTIKIDTRLVSVPVIVSDRYGRYVPNLKASDFTVFQDGVRQDIEFFAATEEPLTIGLLIDTSFSTRPVLDDIRDSAMSFIKLLQPRDRAMIVSFDYDTHILSPLTSSHAQLERAVRNAEIPDTPGTTLRDAAYQTVNRSFAGIKGRKAVIILTDGKDARSQISTAELLYSLQESDTLVYTVMFTTGQQAGGAQSQSQRMDDIFGGRFPNRRMNQRRRDRMERVDRKNEEAEGFLRQMSDATAGRFSMSEDGRLTRTFATIVDELRFQYRLGFYPSDDTSDKELHNLRVKVARPDAVVRSRGSYRVSVAGP